MDITDRLLMTAAEYIEARGGKAVVIGNIEVVRMPTDREFNYKLCINVTGKLPYRKEEMP